MREDLQNYTLTEEWWLAFAACVREGMASIAFWKPFVTDHLIISCTMQACLSRIVSVRVWCLPTDDHWPPWAYLRHHMSPNIQKSGPKYLVWGFFRDLYRDATAVVWRHSRLQTLWCLSLGVQKKLVRFQGCFRSHRKEQVSQARSLHLHPFMSEILLCQGVISWLGLLGVFVTRHTSSTRSDPIYQDWVEACLTSNPSVSKGRWCAFRLALGARE